MGAEPARRDGGQLALFGEQKAGSPCHRRLPVSRREPRPMGRRHYFAQNSGHCPARAGGRRAAGCAPAPQGAGRCLRTGQMVPGVSEEPSDQPENSRELQNAAHADHLGGTLPQGPDERRSGPPLSPPPGPPRRPGGGAAARQSSAPAAHRAPGERSRHPAAPGLRRRRRCALRLGRRERGTDGADGRRQPRAQGLPARDPDAGHDRPPRGVRPQHRPAEGRDGQAREGRGFPPLGPRPRRRRGGSAGRGIC